MRAIGGEGTLRDNLATHLQHTRVDCDELRFWLQDVVRDRRGVPSVIAALSRRDAGRNGSYRSEVLTLRLACGETHELVLKDFGGVHLPAEEATERCERERRVYRDLLTGAGLGTARYFDCSCDPRQGRFWLVLEWVPGDPLRWCHPGHFVAAAAWLGRMQGHFARHPERLRASLALIRHDVEFFVGWAERASRAAGRLSDSLARRLERVIESHEAAFELMTSQPPTLVHGAFRKRNILIRSLPDSLRVCPVDWEHAALGSPLYDLAFLSDRCAAPILDRMWEAYRDALASRGGTRLDRSLMQRLVTCFRLHRVLRTLAEAGEGELTVHRLARVVEGAERLARSLDEDARDA